MWRTCAELCIYEICDIIYDIMQCSVFLCSLTLCYIELCCVVLFRIVSCYVLHQIVLCRVVSCCVVLCCVVLCFSMICYVMLRYVMLWYGMYLHVQYVYIYIHTYRYKLYNTCTDGFRCECICALVRLSVYPHWPKQHTHTMPLSPLDVPVSLSGFPTFPGPGRALEGRRLGMGCPLSHLGFLR